MTEIDKWLGTLGAAVLKLPTDPSRSEIESFIDATIKTAEEIKKLAQAQQLA